MDEVREGIIIKTLNHRSGISTRTGERWETVEYLFGYHKTQESQYLTNVAMSTFDTKYFGIADGTKVKVSFSARSREYQGRWYTQVDLVSLEVVSTEGAMPPAQQTAPVTSVAQSTAMQSIAVDPTDKDRSDDPPF